jgi:saccharopine dehydrogenase (NAD+, L-lysine-forming)
MANAMVLGIGGVGSVIGAKLHQYDCFDRILLADIDPVFAEKLIKQTKNPRFEICRVNALDTRRLVELIKEYKIDITCNACNCYTNDSVLEACCEAGSHYIDMAADFYSPPGVRRPGKASYEYEVEKYHQRYLDKGLAGILCMGMDPGAVNVFARWAMDRLDTATSIRVLDADNAEVRGYRFALLHKGWETSLGKTAGNGSGMDSVSRPDRAAENVCSCTRGRCQPRTLSALRRKRRTLLGL